MKKIGALLVLFVSALGLLSACENKQSDRSQSVPVTEVSVSPSPAVQTKLVALIPTPIPTPDPVLEKELDQLINSRLVEWIPFSHNDDLDPTTALRLVDIGEPAIPYLLAALQEGSEFLGAITLSEHIRVEAVRRYDPYYGYAMGYGHGFGRDIRSPFYFRSLILRVISRIIDSEKDIHDKQLIPALIEVADRDIYNCGFIERILKDLTTKPSLQAEAQKAISRNKPGPDLDQRVTDLTEAIKTMMNKTNVNKSTSFYLENLFVASSLASTLGNIGPSAKNALPVLMELLQNNKDMPPYHYYSKPTDFTEYNRNLQKSNLRQMIKAIGKIGPDAEPAVPLLVKLLEDISNSLFWIEKYTEGPYYSKYSQSTTQRIIDHELIQGSILTSLYEIGPASKAAMPILMEILKSGYDSDLIHLFGVIGPEAKAALPELEKIARDHYCWQEAQKAIAKIKQPVSSSSIK